MLCGTQAGAVVVVVCVDSEYFFKFQASLRRPGSHLSQCAGQMSSGCASVLKTYLSNGTTCTCASCKA